LVQITGNFIYFDGKFTRTITYKDGPQEFDPALEARLVDEGTAKYVDRPSVPVPDEPEQTADDLSTKTMKELKEIAESAGVENVSSFRKKSDLVEAIKAEEEPPTFED